MISTEIRRSQTYVGTGDVNSYTFPFRVFAADQVKVYVRAADAASGTLLDTTQYSVMLASASAQTVGGTVTLSAPLAAGAKLVILSNIPYTQLLALQNQGAFNAEDLNGAWDKNTALIQQVLDTLNRAVLAPELGDDTPEAFTLSLFEARDTAVEKAGEAANSASASAASASDAAASASAAASSAAEAEASKDAINVTKEQVTAEGRKQIATIQTEGGTQISNVQSVGQEQASRVSMAGSAVVADIKLNGQGEVDRITQTGGTWNDTVVATGQKWKQDVISAGSDSLAKATAQAVAAETSANKASGFADAASASAKAAETSENVAVSSATAAGVSEAKAKASETAAASSKTAAAGSASAASQSAAAADTSATEAGGRAAAAAASASAAKTSQNAAAVSAAAAKASEDKAKEYANQASSGQIQADWAETDTAAKSYIKNKPDVRQVTIKKDVSTTGAEYRVTYRQTTADGDSTSYLVASPKLTFNSVTGVLAATGFKGALAGNASTATKLATPRNIKLTGGASGTASFDGSADVTLNVSVASIGTADVGAATAPIYLKAGVPVAGTQLARVATTGAYADLSGRPDLTLYATNSALSKKLDATAKAASAATADALAPTAKVSYSQLTDTPTIPDISGLIPKTGNRGITAGNESWGTLSGSSPTITIDSPDNMLYAAEKGITAITFTYDGNTSAAGKVSTKIIWVYGDALLSAPAVAFKYANVPHTATSWGWFGGAAPTLKKSFVLVCFFHDNYVELALAGTWD